MRQVAKQAVGGGFALLLFGAAGAAQGAWGDLNRDGVPELAKREGTQTVLYSGLTRTALFRFEGVVEPGEISLGAAPPLGASAAPATEPVARRPLGPLALVPNLDSNDVSLFDTAVNQEIARIPVANRPFKAAMTGDGKFGYVTEQQGGRVYKIDLGKRKLATTLQLPTISAVVEVEISPDDRWMVVGEMNAGTVHIVDRTTDTFLNTLVLCQVCDGFSGALFSAPQVAFSPDSTTAYISIAQGDQTLYVVDLATQTVVGSIPTQPTGGTPMTDLDLTSDGQLLYMAETYCYLGVCNYREVDVFAGTTLDFAINPGNPAPDIQLVQNETRIASGGICYGTGCGQALDLFDRFTQTVTHIPTSSASNRHLAYEASRHRVWGVCVAFGGFCGFGAVDVFDAAAETKVKTVLASVFFGNTALSPDEGSFYAIDRFDRVLVVDTETFAISYVNVGTNPRGVFIQGDNRTKFLSP